MSQALVTDFFSQRRKKTTDVVKPTDAASRGSSKSSAAKSRTVSASSSNKDIFSKSSSNQIRDEIMRIIDDDAKLPKGESETCKNPKDNSPTPRIPKRTSPNAELGTDTVLASTEHNTAKKRRKVKVCSVDRINAQVKTRVTRKKCVLSNPKQEAPCKETISAHKSLLQRIKKQADDLGTATSFTSAAASSVQSSIALSKSALTRAKELAAKAKKAKESDLEDEKSQNKTQAQENIQQPAYQKYHNLAQDTPPGLSLPYHFKVLAEMFRSMDTLVAMLFNRLETATFSKIQKGVQDMIHRRFEETHVGQMKTVFPEAYTFRQEKNIPTYNNCIKKGSYQLTVEPALFCGQKEGQPILTASDLLERRHTFHRNLVSIVKHHHKMFLSSLTPQMSVPEDKLTRWHPNFNVDSVPAVQASLLPQPPRVDKLATAQEVLDKAHSLITPKMEKALLSLVQKAEDKSAPSKETSLPNVNCTQTSAPLRIPNALNGVSQSLLDRIRAKEAQKLQAAMTRSPSQEERLLMMSRLGELARILRNVFVSEKKQALNMEVICHRMVTSYRSALTSGEMEKHIRLLAELNPNWLSLHPVRKDLYLKLNKHMDISVILDKLSCNLREEEKR
ncbi:DNA replication factor Cdt1 [Hippocampus comes]|uniref:Chromatin licensing and DNA replication factor 1 n=1 Tax=Hippocampus comes TaxID=109280 RepID=A0A3Q2XDF3_HIPCM|nr:PREDICTED: DNA replication factor Cdt1 [Hippocampus comes]